MAMYRCVCGEWVTTLDPHECRLYPFNVIMTDEDKDKEKNKKVQEIEDILHTLDVAIDELSYAVASGKYQSNSHIYVNNAVRFIQKVKESIHKLKLS